MERLELFFDVKMKDIAARLPSLVHNEPASFACGFNAGYKQCLLDIKKEFLHEELDERIL